MIQYQNSWIYKFIYTFASEEIRSGQDRVIPGDRVFFLACIENVEVLESAAAFAFKHCSDYFPG